MSDRLTKERKETDALLSDALRLGVAYCDVSRIIAATIMSGPKLFDCAIPNKSVGTEPGAVATGSSHLLRESNKFLL
jgi:hypothetical protein